MFYVNRATTEFSFSPTFRPILVRRPKVAAPKAFSGALLDWSYFFLQSFLQMPFDNFSKSAYLCECNEEGKKKEVNPLAGIDLKAFKSCRSPIHSKETTKPLKGHNTTPSVMDRRFFWYPITHLVENQEIARFIICHIHNCFFIFTQTTAYATLK